MEILQGKLLLTGNLHRLRQVSFRETTLLYCQEFRPWPGSVLDYSVSQLWLFFGLRWCLKRLVNVDLLSKQVGEKRKDLETSRELASVTVPEVVA